MTRAETVARFVSEVGGDGRPPAVVARTRDALVDTVGCARLV